MAERTAADGAGAPPFGGSESHAGMGRTAFGKTVKSDAPPATVPLEAGSAMGRLPVEKEPKSGSPLLLLLVAVVVVGAVLAGVMFLGQSDEGSGEGTEAPPTKVQPPVVE
jgi:hypothetical protein